MTKSLFTIVFVMIAVAYCQFFPELDPDHMLKIVNNYRKYHNLTQIPVSQALMNVAQYHANSMVEDDVSCIDCKGNCSLRSWPSPPLPGLWKECCYHRDNTNPECMWWKPKEITKSWDYPYSGDGYEISVWVAGPPSYVTIDRIFKRWRGSSPQEDVLRNNNEWNVFDWKAVGVGMAYDAANNKVWGYLWLGIDTDQNTYIKGSTADLVNPTYYPYLKNSISPPQPQPLVESPPAQSESETETEPEPEPEPESQTQSQSPSDPGTKTLLFNGVVQTETVKLAHSEFNNNSNINIKNTTKNHTPSTQTTKVIHNPTPKKNNTIIPVKEISLNTSANNTVNNHTFSSFITPSDSEKTIPNNSDNKLPHTEEQPLTEDQPEVSSSNNLTNSNEDPQNSKLVPPVAFSQKLQIAIGASAGGILLIVAVTIICIYIRKKRSINKMENKLESMDHDDLTNYIASLTNSKSKTNGSKNSSNNKKSATESVSVHPLLSESNEPPKTPPPPPPQSLTTLGSPKISIEVLTDVTVVQHLPPPKSPIQFMKLTEDE